MKKCCKLQPDMSDVNSKKDTTRNYKRSYCEHWEKAVFGQYKYWFNESKS